MRTFFALCISQTQHFSPTIIPWIATRPCVFCCWSGCFSSLPLKFWIEGGKWIWEAESWTEQWGSWTAVERKLRWDSGGEGDTKFSGGHVWKSESCPGCTRCQCVGREVKWHFHSFHSISLFFKGALEPGHMVNATMFTQSAKIFLFYCDKQSFEMWFE